MNTLTVVQTNTIYSLLQNRALDIRDNRGKRHDLRYVFVSLLLALLRNRDGNLSSLQRSMANKNRELSQSLGLGIMPVISRSYLPVFLQKIDSSVFTEIVYCFLGISLDEKRQQWFAVDGKELRGSIAKGDKRGEAIVLAISHSTRDTYGQNFYSGLKESEKTCVQELLSASGLEHQKVSLDALHLSPKTLTQLEENKGVYVVGLKENQPELLADMQRVSLRAKTNSSYQEIEKGHGRVENRKYNTYCIKNEYFDERWKDVSFQTLIQVKRVIYDCKKKTEYSETAFYISNQGVKNATDFELAHAIRGHWQVESNNYIRDSSLKEDQLRTIKVGVTRTLATFRSLVINLLNQLNPKNRVAQLELFSDNFNILFNWLKDVKVL